MNILIIGGTGVFGSRLARRLIASGHRVTIASRTKQSGQALAREIGAQWIACDLECDINPILMACGADIVVDAAGPFQAPFQAHGDDPYRLAKAAIAKGMHYLDLSDDAAFTGGIADFDVAAKQAGVAVLSGVSSVPALSSAIIQDLVDGLDEITVIESVILPGNQAPRGYSVMAAILAQVGEPIRVWRGNQWRTVQGWSGQRRYDVSEDFSRHAAFIGAPDLRLFPEVFKARSVLFRAGLELSLFQQSLRFFGWLRSKALLPNLRRLTTLFHALAEPFERFGTDTGAMIIKVAGRTKNGTAIQKTWRMRVQSGDGPEVPTLAAEALINRWEEAPPIPGARACIAEHSRAEIEALITALNAHMKTEETPAPTVFGQALEQDFEHLPLSVQRLHDIWDIETFSGKASIARGRHPLVPFIAWVFGFPKTCSQVETSVTIERHCDLERRTRQFGRSRFHSILTVMSDASAAPRLFERFGLFKAELDLTLEEDGLHFPVKRAWLCGLPLPSWLTPISASREYEDVGRFHFDVSLSLPLVGLIVHYRGWLKAAG